MHMCEAGDHRGAGWADRAAAPYRSARCSRRLGQWSKVGGALPVRLLPRRSRSRYGDPTRSELKGMGMAVSADGIGLADAIAALRDELLRARATGAGSDIQLPVESMTVELTVTATRSAEGKAGFKVPLVEVELGGGGTRQRANEQKVTVVFGAPVNRSGEPVKVADAGEELEG